MEKLKKLKKGYIRKTAKKEKKHGKDCKEITVKAYKKVICKKKK